VQRSDFSQYAEKRIIGTVTAQLIAFLPALCVTTVVPGLNNILVLRTTVASGPAAGAATAAGASAGILVWALAAALGVGALLVALPGGVDTVRVAGAGLMLVIGLWGLAPRPTRPAPDASRKGFAVGLAVCLGNPRTPVGALSLLPQYAVADAVTTSTVVLGVVWASTAVLWNLACIWAVSRGRMGNGGSRMVKRLGALALVGLGVTGLLGT
jgi:threonine/homoserine/homoserine lactone efflux protein